jgi:hypothetical protein
MLRCCTGISSGRWVARGSNIWFAITAVCLLVVVCVYAIYGLGAKDSSPISGSGQPTFATATTIAPPFNQSVLQNHLKKLASLSLSGAASDYADNAVLVWTGASQAFGGTYDGPNSIRDLLQIIMGSARNVSVSINSFTSKPSSAANLEDVNATLYLVANSTTLGRITGNIVAEYVFVYANGTWQISQETWNYLTFVTQYSAGMTTFPQWQTVGPPLPQRYSESPFKNWVYLWGGTAAALFVSGYLAAIPIALRLKRREDGKKVPQPRSH